MPYCHGKHFRLLQRHKCCKTPLNGVNVTLQLRLPLLDQYQPMRKIVSTTGWKNHLLTITELVVRSGHCLEGQVIIQLHSTLTVNIFSTCITVSGLYSFVSTSSSKLTYKIIIFNQIIINYVRINILRKFRFSPGLD